MALKIGTPAPDFTLPSTERDTFTLSKDMAGKPCILFFYPKDFSKVCTKEACEFRDHFADFRGLDVTVIGISRDDIDTHRRFKQQYNLPFELLSDASGEVCKKYDALVPILGIPKRITYLLDASHKIVAAYQEFFGARQHIETMLEELKKQED